MEISTIIVLVFNLVLVTIACVVGFMWIRDTVEVSRTVVTRLPPNSDTDAVQSFLGLLSSTDTELLMYDDGDTAEGSLYQSDAVVQALQQKLEDSQRFQIRCVLNHKNGNTAFERTLGNHPRVRIRERLGPKSREHYKIFDGLKAYVSCHELGSKERNRSVIDCTQAVSRRNPKPLALHRYFSDFEQNASW